jgi:hypothetical protein
MKVTITAIRIRNPIGKNSQFSHWMDDFLITEKFVKKSKVDNHYFYRKTKMGEQSGKRLRRK